MELAKRRATIDEASDVGPYSGDVGSTPSGTRLGVVGEQVTRPSGSTPALLPPRLPLCASCQHRHPYRVHGSYGGTLTTEQVRRLREAWLGRRLDAFTAQEHPIPEHRWPRFRLFRWLPR